MALLLHPITSNNLFSNPQQQQILCAHCSGNCDKTPIFLKHDTKTHSNLFACSDYCRIIFWEKEEEKALELSKISHVVHPHVANSESIITKSKKRKFDIIEKDEKDVKMITNKDSSSLSVVFSFSILIIDTNILIQHLPEVASFEKYRETLTVIVPSIGSYNSNPLFMLSLFCSVALETNS
jgi:hypothetical protein